MNNYVPSIGKYIKTQNLSRYDILAQMLESKNPAFVLNCILKRIDTKTLKEYINYTGKLNNLINEAYNTSKIANGTGHGSLHKLAGVAETDTISDAQWEMIGMKISRMQDFNRRDYVGMINFLHVSCDMYEAIHSKLLSLKKNESASQFYGYGYRLNESEDVNFYNSINSVDDLTKMIAYALTKLKDVDCSDIQDEIENGDVNVDDIDNYNCSDYDDDEDDDNGEIDIESDGLTDQYGNQLSSLHETKGYRGGVYHHHRGKGRGDLISMRDSRGNGKGGLKAFIGVAPENDLSYKDLNKIAVKILQNANPDECQQALDSVNYMGSACNSFKHLKNGYLNGISSSKGKNYTASRGYGKKAARKNKINNSTLKSGSKYKYRKKR